MEPKQDWKESSIALLRSDVNAVMFKTSHLSGDYRGYKEVTDKEIEGLKDRYNSLRWKHNLLVVGWFITAIYLIFSR